jgi:hypothetical protein
MVTFLGICTRKLWKVTMNEIEWKGILNRWETVEFYLDKYDLEHENYPIIKLFFINENKIYQSIIENYLVEY